LIGFLQSKNFNKSVRSASDILLSTEARNKTNVMIDQISQTNPFSHLRPESKVFFEEFKKIVDNREYEASVVKLKELSRLFSTHEMEIETMAKRTQIAYYLTIAGVIIGVCGLILPLL
jgi:hypothetical protein